VSTITSLVDAIWFDVLTVARLLAVCFGKFGLSGCICQMAMTLQPAWRKISEDPKARCEDGDPFELLVERIIDQIAHTSQNLINDRLVDPANNAIEALQIPGLGLIKKGILEALGTIGNIKGWIEDAENVFGGIEDSFDDIGGRFQDFSSDVNQKFQDVQDWVRDIIPDTNLDVPFEETPFNGGYGGGRRLQIIENPYLDPVLNEISFLVRDKKTVHPDSIFGRPIPRVCFEESWTPHKCTGMTPEQAAALAECTDAKYELENMCYYARVVEICKHGDKLNEYTALFASGQVSVDELQQEFANAFGDSFEYIDPVRARVMF
jgi:hypothetical protein